MDSLSNRLNKKLYQDYTTNNLKQKVLQKRRETEQTCDPGFYHKYRPWGGLKFK